MLLIGDFTGRIGDPTGKDAARVPLTVEQVRENAQSYRDQVAKILDFDGPTNPVELRYNGEWFDQMQASDMIRLAANFTVQQMIQRDMFQRRLAENKPISVHEFLYPMLQGYDSVALKVDAELGGTDQTFNMLAGRTLMHALQGREKLVFVDAAARGHRRAQDVEELRQRDRGRRPAVRHVRARSCRSPTRCCCAYYEMCTDLDEDALDEIAHMPGRRRQPDDAQEAAGAADHGLVPRRGRGAAAPRSASSARCSGTRRRTEMPVVAGSSAAATGTSSTC